MIQIDEHKNINPEEIWKPIWELDCVTTRMAVIHNVRLIVRDKLWFDRWEFNRWAGGMI